MKLRLQALLELMRHYGRAFSVAWAHRTDLATQPRLDQELAFLPASLELVERPVHPAPRWTMGVLSGFAVLAVILSIVGQLDIVVTAHGKLVPTARVKTVQPAVTGVVRRILVHDGQRVAEGQPLLELDPTQADADQSKVHSSNLAATLARARATALLDAQQQGHAPLLRPVAGVAAEELRQSQQQCDGVYKELQDKLGAAQATTRQREAELESVRHQIDKLRATAPLARQQANDFEALVERKYVTRTEYLDKESNARQMEHELTVQGSRAHELEAAIAAQRSELAAIASQFRKEQLDALDRAKQQLEQGVDDETKARTRRSLMTLAAPTAGTVQQLSVHTEGGVVTAAQTVMTIVPDDALEAEALIENKDVGFVQAGQEVSVKVEAFPYTRYGTLRGIVKMVATDAVQDRRTGLGFVARVQLPVDHVQVGGKPVALTPGMAVTAEIKTGHRSVANFLLDPLVQTSQESLRER